MNKRNKAAGRRVTVRGEWPISPRQRPHSTKKGDRGYDRKKATKEMRHAMS